MTDSKPHEFEGVKPETDEVFVRRVGEEFGCTVESTLIHTMLWYVMPRVYGGGKILGRGKTEADAWANAAKRLREGK